jgi:hypothetical protein
MAQRRVHTDGRQDVHLTMEQILEVLTERDEIRQRLR